MRENQRFEIENRLRKFFELLSDNSYEELKQSMSNDEFQKMKNWFSCSIYFRYKTRMTNPNYKKKMADDYAKLLENLLKLYGISKQEFMDSKGNIDYIIKIIHSSTISIKALQEEKEQLIDKKNEIKEKIYGSSSREYSSDELIKFQQEYEEFGKRIKYISSKLEDIKKDSSSRSMVISINSNDDNKYKKQIDDMMQAYNNTISQLEKEKAELSCENASLKKSLIKQENFVALKQENEDLRKKIKELNDVKKEQLKREKIKNEIIGLLISDANISFSGIQKKLSQSINIYEFKSIMCEIKNEIPGMIKQISDNRCSFNYSLGENADNLIYNYAQNKSWIQLCDDQVKNGTFKFIVRSDTHINLNSSYDDLCKMFEPYFNLSNNHQCAPIIDLGDIADTVKGYSFDDWKNGNLETIKYSYKFYQNYAKAISLASSVKHYVLFGNHDLHPFHCGVDPISVMLNYSDNIMLTGIISSKVKIKNINIGLFHGIIPDGGIKTCDSLLPSNEQFFDIIDEYLKQYHFMLIGHYHFGKVYCDKNTVIVKNGLNMPVLLSVNVVDNIVESVMVETLVNCNGKFVRGYEIEIYNKNNSQKTIGTI